MIKFVSILCNCIVLTGCQTFSDPSRNPAAQTLAHAVPSLTPRETIEQFFDLQYEAYTHLQYRDISGLLDMQQAENRNETIWLKTLIQRRKLIEKHHFCYVETKRFPYTITFDKAAKDDRMEIIEQDVAGDQVTVHFTITGKKGHIYPPFLALNAQHTMRLRQADGKWIITHHFFPGSEQKFGFETALVLPSEQKMLKQLKKEFRTPPAQNSSAQTISPPDAAVYHGRRAADYAKAYTETANPDFYRISDWMGNCSNFTSQCIWYCFCTDAEEPQEIMTPEWFAGTGGGSPAWENVMHFWDYAASEKESGLTGESIDFILQLRPGDLIQIATKHSENSKENYNHSLLLVDSTTLILAQNTPNCFVYYSDLVYADIRFFHPKYRLN
mgnify:CR=1 FL=1